MNRKETDLNTGVSYFRVPLRSFCAPWRTGQLGPHPSVAETRSPNPRARIDDSFLQNADGLVLVLDTSLPENAALRRLSGLISKDHHVKAPAAVRGIVLPYIKSRRELPLVYI